MLLSAHKPSMKRAREHAALDDFVETIFKRRKLSNSSHNQTFAGVHNMLPQHRNTFSEIAKNTTTNPSLMHNDVIAEFRLLELSDEASKAIFESGVDAFFEHQLPSVLKNVWMAVWNQKEILGLVRFSGSSRNQIRPIRKNVEKENYVYHLAGVLPHSIKINLRDAALWSPLEDVLCRRKLTELLMKNFQLQTRVIIPEDKPPQVLLCKICDYRAVGRQAMQNHYQKLHREIDTSRLILGQAEDTGLYKYPCCATKDDTHSSICCDSCNEWWHSICLQLTFRYSEDYIRKLTEDHGAKFTCPSCVFKKSCIRFWVV